MPLALLIALAVPLAFGADKAAAPIRLRVVGTTDVPSSDRDAVEEALAVELIRARCPIRIVEKEDEPADLVLEIAIDRWRESEEPGGAPILGSDGYERPGHISVVEIRGDMRTFRPGEREPRATKHFERSRRAPTMPVGALDPMMEARRQALWSLADDASRLACKDLKALAKERAKSAR